MTDIPQLSRVIIVPRNGYINRLQSWASAKALADTCQASLSVLWEVEEASPAELRSVAEVSQLPCEVITSQDLARILGAPHVEMPRYLTIDRQRRLVFLAGHDKGEQGFMHSLSHAMFQEPSLTTLVIVAGGKFHLSQTVDFDHQRQNFYSSFPWSHAIQDRRASLGNRAHDYIGLHIRETDRSRDAPATHQIQRALRQLRNGTQINELFIAADTDRARDRWLARASSAGFRPWANTGILLDRRDPRAVEAAISDWLTLGRARGLVFSSASSFGQEAAVLSGNLDHTHALRAGLIRRASRDARTKLTQGWQHLRPSE